jgi:hypothetical protein
MSSSGLTFQSHVDTPVLGADVTRLESLGDPHPLDRSLSGYGSLPEDTLHHARLPLRDVYGDISELGRSGKQHLAILDDLVGGVLQDVNVLGSLPPQMKLFSHSLHAVLSSNTDVGT